HCPPRGPLVSRAGTRSEPVLPDEHHRARCPQAALTGSEWCITTSDAQVTWLYSGNAVISVYGYAPHPRDYQEESAIRGEHSRTGSYGPGGPGEVSYRSDQFVSKAR